MKYATVCESCGADLTVPGSVILIFEEYVGGFLTEDGHDYPDGARMEPGDLVRAFCAKCGEYTFNP